MLVIQRVNELTMLLPFLTPLEFELSHDQLIKRVTLTCLFFFGPDSNLSLTLLEKVLSLCHL